MDLKSIYNIRVTCLKRITKNQFHRGKNSHEFSVYSRSWFCAIFTSTLLHILSWHQNEMNEKENKNVTRYYFSETENPNAIAFIWFLFSQIYDFSPFLYAHFVIMSSVVLICILKIKFSLSRYMRIEHIIQIIIHIFSGVVAVQSESNLFCYFFFKSHF